MLQKLYYYLKTPEDSGKKIGLLRVFISIFGGLFVAYLGMTLLPFLIPLSIQEGAVLSIMFNTFVWAICTTWIALSISKLQALLRFLIPTILFTMLLLVLY